MSILCPNRVTYCTLFDCVQKCLQGSVVVCYQSQRVVAVSKGIKISCQVSCIHLCTRSKLVNLDSNQSRRFSTVVWLSVPATSPVTFFVMTLQ
jgi:hypothetical protein